LRPSLGVLQILTAATVVSHRLGWNKSCVEINGCMHYAIQLSEGLEGLVMCSVSCGDQIKRIKYTVGVYMTSITKMHGTMNITFR